MAQVKKVCRICGKEYMTCYVPNLDGVFRWRDVACCLEHGTQYLAKIMASREENADSAEKTSDEAVVDSFPNVDDGEAEAIMNVVEESLADESDEYSDEEDDTDEDFEYLEE